MRSKNNTKIDNGNNVSDLILKHTQKCYFSKKCVDFLFSVLSEQQTIEKGWRLAVKKLYGMNSDLKIQMNLLIGARKRLKINAQSPSFVYEACIRMYRSNELKVFHSRFLRSFCP